MVYSEIELEEPTLSQNEINVLLVLLAIPICLQNLMLEATEAQAFVKKQHLRQKHLRSC